MPVCMHVSVPIVLVSMPVYAPVSIPVVLDLYLLNQYLHHMFFWTLVHGYVPVIVSNVSVYPFLYLHFT